jgi:tetratricopeptide (TPR) repeat protein
MKRVRSSKSSHRFAQPMLLGRWWLQGAILVFLVAVVYQPTLTNGFIWDDDIYVAENPTLRSLQGLSDIWFKLGAVPQYYPLVHSTFWVEAHLWGTFPGGFHAVNMLLHATAVLLVWRLLARLAVPGAWLAAAIFAVHPVGVESVAWVTERKNVLSCVLALGALLAYLRFSPADRAGAARANASAERGDWRYYALALGLYVLALLSKTVTASMPAVLLVIYWWKRGSVTRRDFARLAPFFAVGLALAALTVWMEKEHVGAKGEAWDLSPIERLLIAGRALWFYAGKLAWPHPLVFFYPRWTVDASAWWQYLFPAAALGVMVLLWRARNRIGRGPLAAVLVFAGVLTPALGFFNVYPFLFSFVADHFQYHASIALMAAAAAALVLSARHLLPRSPWVVPLAAAAVLLPLAVLARSKTAVYRDLVSLYADTIASNPTAWAAHLNLGYCLQQESNFEEAAAHYREALRINPQFAPLHIRLGTVLFLSGKTDESTAELNRALAGNLDDLNRSTAHVHLGIMLNAQGRFDDAIAHFRNALALRPNASVALFHYGIALEARGELKSGIQKVRESLAINPNSALAQNRLGTMLASFGKVEEAVAPLETAVRLQPLNAGFHENLAAALITRGDLMAAENHLRQAIQLDPRSADAHYFLGVVFAHRADLSSAIAQYQAALKIDPAHAEAAANLKKARHEGP